MPSSVPETTLKAAVERCANHDPWSDDNFIKVVHDPNERRFLPSRQGDDHDEASVIGFIPKWGLADLKLTGVLVGQDVPISDKVAFVVRQATGDEPVCYLYPSRLDYAARTAQIQRVSALLRSDQHFAYIDRGWRDELYTVYGSSQDGHHSVPLFDIERSVCSTFGFLTFGVHATAYTPEPELRIWVPRRAANKQTWPGMLDNTVAGGLASGETPRDALIREAAEEAGLPADLVDQTLRPTGLITYFHCPGDGRAQPEMQYVYDMCLPPPPEAICKPIDGEAEDFRLLSPVQVLEALRQGEFKPNCALILLDFFMRHDLFDPKEAEEMRQIESKLHTNLGLSFPSFSY